MPRERQPNPKDDKPMSAMERYAAMREQSEEKASGDLAAYVRKPGTRKANPDSTFTRRVPERAEYPRRVRAGLKVSTVQWPPEHLPAHAAPMLTLIESLFTTDVINEAFKDYAQRGQTRAFRIEIGSFVTEVQGRRFKPYDTVVSLETIEPARWDQIIEALVSDPLLNARLLSGEFPEQINTVFEHFGVSLLPSPQEELTIQCTCAEPQPCKHGACTAMLLAEAIAADPFVLLPLRGMAKEQLAERLRQRRALASSTTGLVPAFAPPPPGESASSESPIEAAVESFWDAGIELRDLEIPIKKPEISYPLLRRLGPSPFEEGKFPLVGLLATCYELISEEALRLESEPELESDSDEADPDQETSA
jgi:uncharacterized Zn finger protein